MNKEVTEADRLRLGNHVKRRRQELGLSVRAAAKQAGIDRATWTGLEDGSRTTRDENYAAIERALQWQIGSIEDILRSNNGTPTVLTDNDDEASTAGYLAAILDEHADKYGEDVLHEAWRLRESKKDGV